jgi:hypothetical protein
MREEVELIVGISLAGPAKPASMRLTQAITAIFFTTENIPPTKVFHKTAKRFWMDAALLHDKMIFPINKEKRCSSILLMHIIDDNDI